MLGTPSGPEAFARQLLRDADEQDESSSAIVAAAERAHLQLRASLSVFFGQAGFDSLWTRAVSLTQLPPGDAGTREAAHLLRGPDWAAALNGRSLNETRAVVLTAFTSFIALLFTFVGADLGARLIAQVWPESPLDAPRTSRGEDAA